MKILPLVRAEFARLTASRLGIASLIAIMIVPIVYGGLYLWGNKDPYSNLDKVPAALVVADSGATVGGKAVNYGKDAATQLLTDMKFGWTEVTESQARAGVTSGKYDFAVTFPEEFSSDLASAGSSLPIKASIDLRTDDTNSYLSTTIAKQATEAVRVAVAEKVGKSASRQLLDAVASIRGGLVDARDGSSRLADGAATAAGGASDLSTGLATLDSGAAALPSSTAELSSGAAQVAAGAKRLDAAAPAAAQGSAALSAGLKQLAATSPQVRADLASVLANSTIPAQDQGRLLAELDAISAGAAQSSAGASTLATRLKSLPSSAAQLYSGASQVAAGTRSLASRTPALASGIHSAASGASSLSTGIAKLHSGADTLYSSLNKGVDQLPATTAAERAAKAAQIANPAEVKQHAVTEAQNYGAGLAPFFISLAGWIGLYALFLLVRPLSRRALTAVRRPIRTTLAGWITPAVLGVVQMVALFALVTLALHLRVADGAGLLAFMALVAVTFAAMILALNVLFGSVGQFLALILMIVQLVTAGGTFPWQTLPAPLAFIHQALPMSHAVDGVRQLMYGGASGSLWGPVSFLLAWLVGSLIVSTLGALRQGRFRTLTQLRPSAIGG
ncbi:MAG: conserved rane protein [Glaciihabitans sp.]|nr:conserved rane protein [Glaciihabitans sp.]